VKLWKISQTVNTDYDTYDSAVVAAESDIEARYMHPRGDGRFSGSPESWASPDDVTAEYIGEAKAGMRKGTICASFNAG
jgi:hypothetical protein